MATKKNTHRPSNDLFSSFAAEVVLSFNKSDSETKLTFGPLMASLCKGIRDHGTLVEAAKEAGVSYSHAWESVVSYEKANDVEIVIRKKPKGCWLTPLGEELLKGYLEIKEGIDALACECYEETFVTA